MTTWWQHKLKPVRAKETSRHERLTPCCVPKDPGKPWPKVRVRMKTGRRASWSLECGKCGKRTPWFKDMWRAVHSFNRRKNGQRN